VPNAFGGRLGERDVVAPGEAVGAELENRPARRSSTADLLLDLAERARFEDASRMAKFTEASAI